MPLRFQPLHFPAMIARMTKRRIDLFMVVIYSSGKGNDFPIPVRGISFGRRRIHTRHLHSEGMRPNVLLPVASRRNAKLHRH
jgi:hypothetical protein